ncbi:MAG: hypothetical protein EOO14_03955 [Chitinophagaceae bacterium]|nr:MAG: hypothetical protein EOO14_03955 [Chitinophagaceae bacterium]
MKILLLFLGCTFVADSFAQNIGVDVTNPPKKLSVNGSVMIDAMDKNTGTLDSASLVFGSDGRAGINSPQTGSCNGCLEFYTTGARRLSIDWMGRVQVGPEIDFPSGMLLVSGGMTVDNGDVRFRNSAAIGGNPTVSGHALAVHGNTHLGGNISVNAANPTIQFRDGATTKGFIQITGDNLRMGTNSGNDAGNFIIRTNGGDRVTVDGSGNMNVQANLTTSANMNVQGNLTANGDMNVQGDLTVNGNKGVLYNSHGSGQLKYYTRTASFTATLGANALSSESSVGFTPGIFSSPPKVFAGDIVSTGGVSGELFRVQLIIYNVTTTSCKVRLLNTSNSPVNYNVVWNIVCLGE